MVKYVFFVAHSVEHDGRFALDLEAQLRDLPTFVSSRAVRTGNWPKVVAEAQRNSAITVVLLSQHVLHALNQDRSLYVQEEIVRGAHLATSGPHLIVPVYLDGKPDSELVPYPLAHQQAVNGLNRLPGEIALELRAMFASHSPRATFSAGGKDPALEALHRAYACTERCAALIHDESKREERLDLQAEVDQEMKLVSVHGFEDFRAGACQLVAQIAVQSYAMHEVAGTWRDYVDIYSAMVLKLADRVSKHELSTAALNYCGISCRMNGRWREARELFDSSLEIAGERADLQSDAEANLCDLERVRQRAPDEPVDLTEARRFGMLALRHARSLNDSKRIARAYEVLGLVEVGCAQFDTAVTLYFPARDLRSEFRKSERALYARVLSYLTYAQALSTYPRLARVTYREAKEIADEVGDEQAVARLRGDLATSHIRGKKWPEALKELMRCVEYYRSDAGSKLGRRFFALCELRRAMACAGLALESQRERDLEAALSALLVVESCYADISSVDIVAIDADRFLRKIARKVSGTSSAAGKLKEKANDVSDALQAKRPIVAVAKLPAPPSASGA